MRGIVPELRRGARVDLRRDEGSGTVLLRVAYDEAIPTSMDQARELGLPVWASAANNSPDIRIDAYVDGTFSGALVLDAKYRRFENIWDPRRRNTTEETHAMQQLLNYRYRIVRADDRELFAVRQVVALCPTVPVEGNLFHEKDDHVTILGLLPGDPNGLGRLEALLRNWLEGETSQKVWG